MARRTAWCGTRPTVADSRAVDQYYSDPSKLTESIATNLQKSDGLMVFDIVHIIDRNLWKEVEAGMKEGGAI